MGFRVSGGINTCLDCQERHTACHDTCEKYLEAKKKHEERQDIINKERYKYRNFDAFKAKNVALTKKRGRIRSNNSSVINHKSHEKGD